MYSDNKLIRDFVSWLRERFPRFYFEVKRSLRELLPEPKKYKSFWKHQWVHADICVFTGKKLVCIIEPGGYQHLTDEEQRNRDRKKKSICNENDVYFLPLINQALLFREHNQFKKLLKNAFYSKEGILCLI